MDESALQDVEITAGFLGQQARSQAGGRMSERGQMDPETGHRIRSFMMRYPRTAFLVACGALALGGYILGVALALWYWPVLSGVVGALWMLPVAALVSLAWGRWMPWSPTVGLRGCLVALSAFGLLVASCVPESKFLPYPYIDTCFAPAFDRESFERLHPGMSTAEVEAVAGAPLFLRSQPPWSYRLPGDPDLVWSYSSDHCSSVGDYAWRSYQVGFRNGSVIVVSTAWRYD
jgi:hypothetical protein